MGLTLRNYAALFLLTFIPVFINGCGQSNPAPTETVIFTDSQGRKVTLEEINSANGSYKYEVLGGEKIPAEANLLHQQGRAAGAKGDYAGAIKLFEQATQLAPDWPYPGYDAAFTYLLMNDPVNAKKFYKKTVELEPRGYFTAITALDSLEREEKGEIPQGTYLAYLFIEDLKTPEEKLAAAKKILGRVPSFAPTWKEVAVYSEDVAEQDSAMEKALSLNPDPETKGVLEINRASHLFKKDPKQAVKTLSELILDPKSTYGTQQMAKITLGILMKEKKN